MARLLPESTIEFLGRIDQQVKIRGFRIELGEIEEALNSHFAVQKAVVLAQKDKPNHKRLVAYIVQKPNYGGANETESELSAEMVAHWQTLYDQTYAEPEQQGEVDFNIVGWNSSYTGKPLPDSEMRSWLDNAVASINKLKPARVLEIGCGTGLLVSELRHCASNTSALTFHRTLFAMSKIGYLKEGKHIHKSRCRSGMPMILRVSTNTRLTS